ncbi:PopZ family protein [Variibacter gotjawalensis]
MARPVDEPVVIEPEEEPEYHAPAAVQAREEPRWTEPVTETALVSPQTSDAVNSAFNALAHSVMAQNSERLDEMSRQMLRPMLKAWLDDNLPSIVERLVRAEIERVARGR